MWSNIYLFILIGLLSVIYFKLNFYMSDKNNSSFFSFFFLMLHSILAIIVLLIGVDGNTPYGMIGIVFMFLAYNNYIAWENFNEYDNLYEYWKHKLKK